MKFKGGYFAILSAIRQDECESLHSHETCANGLVFHALLNFAPPIAGCGRRKWLWLENDRRSALEIHFHRDATIHPKTSRRFVVKNIAKMSAQILRFDSRKSEPRVVRTIPEYIGERGQSEFLESAVSSPTRDSFD